MLSKDKKDDKKVTFIDDAKKASKDSLSAKIKKYKNKVLTDVQKDELLFELGITDELGKVINK